MPRRQSALWWIACLATFLFMGSAALAQRYERHESPFTAIRWDGARPEVMVRGEWYRPLFIHGVNVRAILGFCERHWPGEVQRRFGEDLVEAMALMGREPPTQVDLVLERVEGGGRVTIAGVLCRRRTGRRFGSRGPARPLCC